MANPFGYQSAFSMFLASQQNDSPPSGVDSPGPALSENSQGSPNLSQSNNSGQTESSHSLEKTPSEQSNSMTSQLQNCASTDSMSEKLVIKMLHPESPPPSEDANMETAQMEPHDDEDPVATAEESVDDTPHFQAAFERTLNQDTNDDSLMCSDLPDIDLRGNKQSIPVQMLPPDIDDESQLYNDKIDSSKIRTMDAETESHESNNLSIEQESTDIGAEKLFEYQWPQETGGDIYMLQEHVSEFLGVLSFKRKYPDLSRRPVEYHERLFLLEKGAVTETQCDLGLTALRSEEVYELMAKDYPEKYKEYISTLREREKKKVSDQNKAYAGMSMEKSKVDFFMKKAVLSAAEYNAQFMREKREERQAYIDLQTLEIHYPKNRNKPLPKELTNPGAYPVALIPGQFQEYYKKYTPQELKYFPVQTALYSPHKVLKTIYADPSTGVDKENAEEDGDKDDCSSSSDDSQSSSSDSEADSIEPESNEVKISEEQIKKLLATPRPDTPPKKRRRRMPANCTDTVDSEKDSETGSVKGSNRRQAKTPNRRIQSRTPKGRPKPPKDTSSVSAEGRPPLPQNLQCNICQEVGLCDKDGQYLEMAQCSECLKYAHIVCLELTDEMVPIIKTYPWQCMECKTCVKCKDAQDEENMMFCDHCDRGYHTFCVGLKAIPPGRWECPSCVPEPELTETTPRRRGKQK